MDTTGTVYVLTNPSLKSMVKIGFTTRTAAIRAKELSGTSLPTPFEVFYESDTVKNARAVERVVHNELIASRIQNGREFFKVTPQEAQAAIEAAAANANAAAPEPHVITVKIPDGVDDIVLRLERTTLAAGN